MRWDVFCRVIDNHGDLGVCWRLARGLAVRGQGVRLWVDDPTALRWMAPHGASGVEVVHWGHEAAVRAPGDVVIEAFGCDPPADFVAAMAERSEAPLWINLEYLSAEPWIERSHRLPSPQPGGLTKWFFFPGFTPATGGLLREPGLLAERDRFDRAGWLAQQGITLRPGERLLSLFCYPNAPIDALPGACGGGPTRLLLCGGARAPARPWPSDFECQSVPWLDHDNFDRLLWSCDLNFVRGEDSLVRAVWAGAAFVWQPYPQHDGVHALKLQALAERFGAADVPGLTSLWRRWNGLEAGPLELPHLATWQALVRAWTAELAEQPDLVSQLLTFAAEKLSGATPSEQTRAC